MIIGIRPPGGSYPIQPINPPNDDQWIISQMENYEKELRADMGPPPNVEKLEKLLKQLEQFLEEHKNEIYKIMEKNGYPVSGPFSISAMYDSAVDALKNYLANPSEGGGSLDLLNESITQMNFYFTNHNR